MPEISYEERTKYLKDAFEEVVTTNEKTVATLNKGLAKEYAAMLKQLKIVLSSAHEKYAVDGRLTWVELQRYDRIKKLEAEIDETIKNYYAPIRKQVVLSQKKVIEQTYTGSMEALNTAAGLDIDPYITGEQIKEMLDKPWMGVALLALLFYWQTRFTDQVKNDIRRGTLGSGSTYEDNINNLKDRITKEYAGLGRTNEDIAHSYQTDTQQSAFNRAYEKGAVVTKEWQTMQDEKVRDSHAAMLGQVVDADDMFTFAEGINAGEQTDGPAISGIPGEDINCRCWMSPSIRLPGEE